MIALHAVIMPTLHKKVAVIIPTKDYNLVKTCVSSLIRTHYKFYHIYIAYTGPNDENLDNIIEFCKTIPDKNISLINYGWYNFAKINNDVVFNFVDESYDYLMFCNDDIVFDDDFLTKAMEQNLDNVGTIGSALLFPDKTIQHLGQFMIIKEDDHNMGLSVGHIGYGMTDGYINDLLKEKRNGNTFALVITPHELFKEINGLNENYKECFEDVEYNLECLLRDKKHIILNTKVIHHESKTRNQSEDKKYNMNHDYYNNLMPFVDRNYTKLKTILKR